MITRQAARRRRGRAIRKSRRLRTAPLPPALIAAFRAVLDHIRREWALIQDALKFVRQIFTAPPPRPLIHNGKKPR